MQESDIKPAREFAQQFGVKSVLYGKPGAGKTPVATTAPRPLILASEPGLLTLKNNDTPTYPAFTGAKLADFFAWWFGSLESKKYETLIWDSASQGAEILVQENLGGVSKAGNDVHGQRAYGQMSRQMMEWLTKLYFQPKKHIILITKMSKLDMGGSIYHQPYFPGKELNTRVPHLFDLVACLGDWNIPGVTPSPTKAFRCKEDFAYMGRDRSGNLNEYEPPNFTRLFEKCMK